MPEIKVLIVGNHHVGPEEGRVDLNSTVTLIKSNKKKLVSISIDDDENPDFSITASALNEQLTKHFA